MKQRGRLALPYMPEHVVETDCICSGAVLGSITPAVAA